MDQDKVDDTLDELSLRSFVKVIREEKLTHTTFEDSVKAVPYGLCDSCGSMIPRGSVVQCVKYYEPNKSRWEVMNFCKNCGAK